MPKQNPDSEPVFFATPARMREWFARHRAGRTEVWVGFYKKGTGHPSVTWPEAVDEALCVGWIDGIRKGIDEGSYKIRFTPRKATSTWSAINIARMKVLTSEGRVTDEGIAAFGRRSEKRSGIYSYEQRETATLEPAQEKRFRANRAAWKWFSAQPPSYRHVAIWKVVSAKRADTRARRLDEVIACAERGVRIPSLRR